MSASSRTGADAMSSLVDPWLSKTPDCKTQTGGDWYNIMLAASLGGKPAHGCNTAPTCEVLCKSSSFENSDRSVGHIRWDNRVLDRPYIGADLSDQYYTHHAFKGTVTNSGNILAYESGLWEPSLRSRAKATSLLAAGIHAHGCSIRDAITSVSSIASDDIDEEAVACAILPASHLKREMTIVSKATHRIFTRGTLQSGIEWDDTDLTVSSRHPSMAFDWGRVTAIARYIAEANIQTCSKFRQIAGSIGVPFFVVRDAWAYVSPTDYHLIPSMFTNVPKLRLDRYRIPSLKGAFLDHEEDIIIAITRSIDQRSFIPDSDTLKAYTELYRSAKMRKGKRHKRNVVNVSDYLDPKDLHSHMTHDSIRAYFIDSQIPVRALSQAVATRRAKDPSVRDVVANYLKCMDKPDTDVELVRLDEVSKSVFTQGTWVMAKAIGEENVKEQANSEELQGSIAQFNYSLSKLKSEMFGIPTHIISRSTFTNEILVRLRPYVRGIMRGLDDVQPLASMTQERLAGSEMQEVSSIIAQLTEKAEKWLPSIQGEVSGVFMEWASRFSDSDHAGYIQAEANLFFTAYALKHLAISDCKNQTTGFIDGAAPERSYVWKALKKLAKKYGREVHKLRRYFYTSAHQLAAECDREDVYNYNVTKAVKFVSHILEEVVSDLLVDRLYAPNDSILQRIYDANPAPASPGYDTSMLDDAEDLARLSARITSIEERRVLPVEDKYTLALNSYPNAQLAEQYAQVSGYKTFKEAFHDLGDEVTYLESNRYIASAASLLELKRPTKGSGSKKRGYESLI